jgi:hypothetical protein
MGGREAHEPTLVVPQLSQHSQVPIYSGAEAMGSSLHGDLAVTGPGVVASTW